MRANPRLGYTTGTGRHDPRVRRFTDPSASCQPLGRGVRRQIASVVPRPRSSRVRGGRTTPPPHSAELGASPHSPLGWTRSESH